ncbi:purine-binding chemotaxis protein CheW [Haloarcula quadrata]|jgi:purine-binding chemotaxis protein CheW|uniref:Chemotaxis signal transduction protein CheW n=4 Tax=Haloarcula TaxID=2237 RepID=Q5V243_HALMA|nr:MULTISPECIES: chemotaxis protein CheW [Haloarcula]AAV46409.1 chemotaxis signal transduction protein CheW [Haloarcula marismortui ATCC 43049]EMA09695.1 chemotaxis signal transduction protein CheW [Haloarcula californiae ATCC 33799]EMA16331.1 chemotaxis signal transduction protein CheW [Haloarcula sinaiiensis ATCC 33800]NHN62388.1 purine-binding chemotaxis protein CheW [Haloarcula sp. JP-Z28]QCP91139.1 purine-binding chemotaxis protein CheW [Haloarcula marismortui ATCC 43049]
MSDDERMDRAERIRQMREGNKAETTDDTAESDEASADGSGKQPDDEGETEATAGEAADAEPATAASDDASNEAAAADGQVANDGDTDTDSDSAATDQSDTDAMAAAQRAAEASAQMTPENVDAGVADQPTDDLSASASPMQGPTGVELPDQELIEEAMASDNTATTEGGARAAAIDDDATQTEELVRVLEFALGDEYYCLDIDYVEEIVKRESVTRVPNTDDYVEGVVDLRGQITTILNPKEMMDIESDGSENLIVVFDAGVFEEQGAMGWIVDEVRQVVPVAESEVNTAPVDGDYINGVVDRDGEDEFVIWIEPDDVLGNATADGED